jgi:hypothetical protein
LEDAGGGLGTEAFGDGVEHLSDDEEDGKLELPSTFSALEKLPSRNIIHLEQQHCPTLENKHGLIIIMDMVLIYTPCMTAADSHPPCS